MAFATEQQIGRRPSSSGAYRMSIRMWWVSALPSEGAGPRLRGGRVERGGRGVALFMLLSLYHPMHRMANVAEWSSLQRRREAPAHRFGGRIWCGSARECFLLRAPAELRARAQGTHARAFVMRSAMRVEATEAKEHAKH
eukprot:6292448-Prymnesium_polylepis.1